MLSRFLDWHIELTFGAIYQAPEQKEKEQAWVGGRMVRMMKSIGI